MKKCLSEPPQEVPSVDRRAADDPIYVGDAFAVVEENHHALSGEICLAFLAQEQTEYLGLWIMS